MLTLSIIIEVASLTVEDINNIDTSVREFLKRISISVHSLLHPVPGTWVPVYCHHWYPPTEYYPSDTKADDTRGFLLSSDFFAEFITTVADF
jgi:hypothetical protein